MSLRARHRTVAHTGAVLGGKVSKAAPAPALGAGEQMQIEIVPAWPPAHCSAIKTDGRVLHVRQAAPAHPHAKIAKGGRDCGPGGRDCYRFDVLISVFGH